MSAGNGTDQIVANGAESLGQAIAERIREDIVEGELAPGTRLSQEALSARFGVSRMPARDALRQLVQEGLVTALSPRRFVVAQLTAEDVEDMWAIEAILFGYTARRATVNGSPEDIGALEGLHREMLEATERGDIEAVVDLNRGFHRSIHALAQSAKLNSLYPVVHTPLPKSYLVGSYRDPRMQNAEHAAILTAMRAGDASTAELLMIAHVQAAGAALIGHVRERGALSS